MEQKRRLLATDEIKLLPVGAWEVRIKDALTHNVLEDGTALRDRLVSLAEASKVRVYLCEGYGDGTTQLDVEGELSGWINIG